MAQSLLPTAPSPGVLASIQHEAARQGGSAPRQAFLAHTRVAQCPAGQWGLGSEGEELGVGGQALKGGPNPAPKNP